MYISELPVYIMQTALLRQIEQGNKPDAKLYLDLTKDERNFNWDETVEEHSIWSSIFNAINFRPFMDFHNLTFGELNENNPNYIAKIKQTTNKKKNKLFNKNFY